MQDDGGVGTQGQIPRGNVEGTCGAEHLTERVTGDERDQQVCRRWGDTQAHVHTNINTVFTAEDMWVIINVYESKQGVGVCVVFTGADTRVVVCQQEALHPVLHVLQHPAVNQFITGRLNSEPVQTLRRVILNHLQHREIDG